MYHLIHPVPRRAESSAKLICGLGEDVASHVYAFNLFDGGLDPGKSRRQGLLFVLHGSVDALTCRRHVDVGFPTRPNDRVAAPWSQNLWSRCTVS